MDKARLLFVLGLVAFISFTLVISSPFSWQTPDQFDYIMDWITTVNEENCRSKHPDDLVLPTETVAQIPRYNKLLSEIWYTNRSALLHLHNIALNRAYYTSFIFQSLNASLNHSSIDFWYNPGLMYYYMSSAADVSASPGFINGSTFYFDNNCNYANFLKTLPFNSTLPLFAPSAWRADDTTEPTNWLREPTNNTVDVHDMGAGRDSNYTHPGYKPNTWYNYYLPDLTSDADTIKKFTYSVGIKRSTTTGEFVRDEFEGTNFFGPPQPGQQDADLTLPVRFTKPYFDCRRSNKWIVSAVAPIADYMPRYTNYTHLRRPRIVGVIVTSIEFERIDINQCPLSEGNPEPNLFADTARCHYVTSMCEPLSGYGFRRGGYQCVCRPGHRYPYWHEGPFLGVEMEQATEDEREFFKCLPVAHLLVIPKSMPYIVGNDDLKEMPYYTPTFERTRRSTKDRFIRSVADDLQPEMSLNPKYRRLVSKQSVVKSRRKRDVTYDQRIFERVSRSFDPLAFDRMERIMHRYHFTDRTTCQTLTSQEKLLPGDVIYGVNRQFEPQGRTALRLAHFLSNFLQNVNEDEQFGDIRGDKLLNETQLYGEVLANIMGDFKVKASGIFYDRYKFRMQPPMNNTDPRLNSGVTREFFGPFAYRKINDEESAEDGLDEFYSIDISGLDEADRYINKRWFMDMKSRWATNFYSLQKYTMRSMVRYNAGGESIVRFEHYPVTYRAPTYEDGVWLRPEYKCDGRVNAWVVTYVAPFFGLNSLKTQLEFKGVVTVDVGLDELDISQCPNDFHVANAFKGTARCDFETTYCVPLPGGRFERGYYKCECRQGYEYPFLEETWYFHGMMMEDQYNRLISNETNRFETLKCRIAGSAIVTLSWTLMALSSSLLFLLQ